MKLYYTSGACSLAVRIAIHEIGVACEFEAVDLRSKQTKTGADFTKINAKGAVPVLQLDSGEVLTENAVIQQFLADTHKATQLLPVVGDIKRYHVLEWLNFISTDLHKGCSPLFNSNLPAQIKEEIFKPALKTKLNFVDTHLAKNKYLLGEQFTIADGYLFVVLSWLKHFQVELTDWLNLSRYFTDVKNREAVQKSLKEEGLV